MRLVRFCAIIKPAEAASHKASLSEAELHPVTLTVKSTQRRDSCPLTVSGRISPKNNFTMSTKTILKYKKNAIKCKRNKSKPCMFVLHVIYVYCKCKEIVRWSEFVGTVYLLYRISRHRRTCCRYYCKKVNIMERQTGENVHS